VYLSLTSTANDDAVIDDVPPEDQT